jgi:hypothetical protein
MGDGRARMFGAWEYRGTAAPAKDRSLAEARINRAMAGMTKLDRLDDQLKTMAPFGTFSAAG